MQLGCYIFYYLAHARDTFCDCNVFTVFSTSDYSDVLLLSKVTKLREGTGPLMGGDRSPYFDL